MEWCQLVSIGKVSIITDSVTTIEDCAFIDCQSLETITIPDSVKTIGTGVFDDCENLCEIHVSAINKEAIDQLQNYADLLVIE